MTENLVENPQQEPQQNQARGNTGSFKEEYEMLKTKPVQRELSNKYLIRTFNILIAIVSFCAIISSSAKFINSTLRFSEFPYIFFNSLFHLSNLLRCLKQMFARESFGFFYNNKFRGCVVFVVCFLVLPDFSSLDFGGVCGIINLALSVVTMVMGFWVVDIVDVQVV